MRACRGHTDLPLSRRKRSGDDSRKPWSVPGFPPVFLVPGFPVFLEGFSAVEQSRRAPAGNLLPEADAARTFGSCRPHTADPGHRAGFGSADGAHAGGYGHHAQWRPSHRRGAASGGRRTAHTHRVCRNHRVDWGQVSDVRLDAPATVLLDDERVVTVAALKDRKNPCGSTAPAGREPMTVATNQVRVIQPEPWEMGDGGKFSGRINLALEDQTGNSGKAPSWMSMRPCAIDAAGANLRPLVSSNTTRPTASGPPTTGR